MDSKYHCEICKRPVMNMDVKVDNNLAYCRPCHHFTPLNVQVIRKREEIYIPEGLSIIRLGMFDKELTIEVDWKKNFLHAQLLEKDLFVSYPERLVARMLNKTVIKVDPKMIKIIHHPLKILPDIYYFSQNIKQIFIRKPERINHFTGKGHALYIENDKGQKEAWIYNFRLETLLYLEQEIERILGIKDRKMEEEVIDVSE